eukprot:TRINITY_DN63087_c0_g1_i1.p1 TRINITY_DN63087_c0_g1~~TRINITY_DN63087_c0_g1_i1.p1  ORF type:complete len:128 (+),score=29.21 TRINITY_DN63087_c0_g1_i1:2-385(+)
MQTPSKATTGSDTKATGMLVLEEASSVCPGESLKSSFIGFVMDFFVVWPVGTMIRKKVSYAESFGVRDMVALPSAIGLSSWLVAEELQNGDFACMPWTVAVPIATVGGLVLQLINFLVPYKGDAGGN